MNSRFLHCVYAEDIRHETTGQFSLIGCFQGGLKIPSPGNIPKLSIKADLFFPLGDVPKQCAIQVLLGDQMIQEIPVPAAAFAEAMAKADKQSDPDMSGIVLQFLLTFAPFVIDKPGKVRIRAAIDGTQLWGNALQLEVGDAPGVPQAASPGIDGSDKA